MDWLVLLLGATVVVWLTVRAVGRHSLMTLARDRTCISCGGKSPRGEWKRISYRRIGFTAEEVAECPLCGHVDSYQHDVAVADDN